MNEQEHANHAKVKALFAAAADLPAAQRAAFVESATSGEPAVRAQVMRLLAAASDSDDFLRQPTAMARPGAALGDTPTPSASSRATPTIDHAGHHSRGPAPHDNDELGEGVGTVIGPYRLLKVIGEGGFGRVFLAEQSVPVKRHVAVKIIKLGMDTRQVVARFEQERQALALMDHPHIAKVLDGGATQSGRPYFVMEYCQGESITAFADHGRLPVPERLALLLQVCRAVQHAHQKGLIHRDIKPSNVLVSMQDGRPFVKVIDFGIAKATQARLTERTLFTEHRQLIGTPEYMSPEQAEGSLDIDTRTDLYSLGVLMYELLTGVTPFSARQLRSAAYGEIQRIIREVEPPRPSTRLSQHGEHLAGIAARRQTEPARLGRLVRGELDWIVMKALAKDRAHRYDTAVSLAEDLERYLSGQAVRAAPPSLLYRARTFIRRHRVLVSAGSAVVAALILGAAAATAGLVSASRQRDEARRSEREAVAARAEAETARTQSDQARSEAELVTGFLAGVLEAADPSRQGRDVTMKQVMAEAASRVGPEITAQPRVEARVRETLGRTYLALGEFAEAQRNIDLAVSLSIEALGPTHERTLLLEELRARLLYHQGQHGPAERGLRDVLKRAQDAAGPNGLATLAAQAGLGMVLSERGRSAEAEPLLAAAVQGLRTTRGEDDEQTIAATVNLAAILGDVGKAEESIRLHEQVIARAAAKFGNDAPATLQARGNYAWLLQAQGRSEDAAREGEKVLQARRRLLGEDHPQTLTAMNNLAVAYAAVKRRDEAEPLYLAGLAAERRTKGDEHPDTLVSVANLAKFYLDGDQPDKALPLFQEATAAMPRVFTPMHPISAQTLLGHGICLRKLGRTEDALERLTQAFHLLRMLGPQMANAARRAAQEAAMACDAMNKPDDAAEWRTKAEALKPPAAPAPAGPG